MNNQKKDIKVIRKRCNYAAPTDPNKPRFREQTKRIALALVNKAYRLYPEWHKQQKLPVPIKPSSLNNVNLSAKRMEQIPLDPIVMSVLCGTICGDSSIGIHPKYVNARIQLKHSTRQLTWFVWKMLVLLQEFTNAKAVIFTLPDGKQSESEPRPGEVLGKLKIASKVDPSLTQLHNIIVDNKKKTIKRFWLNHMNNYFLMTLWLDDGSLTNGRPSAQGTYNSAKGRIKGVFCLNSFTDDDRQIFRDYLWTVWGVETKLQPTGLIMSNGREAIRISIANQESLLKLFRVIAPVIPVREMLYKVCFVPYNNPSLLQRWKTELLTLVRPEFREDIVKFYSNISN